jgi:hypothetical protein
MSDQDVGYMMKAKRAGIPDQVIAKKLNVSVEELDRQFRSQVATVLSTTSNGYKDLTDSFVNMCHQYQLVGESLKMMGAGLNELATLAEVQDATGMNQEASEKLMVSFIVLRKFVPKVELPVSEIQGN